MEQRVSLATLGVRDLPRARAFYEGLGWTTPAGPEDDVVFFQTGGMVIAEELDAVRPGGCAARRSATATLRTPPSAR